ncbi:unnamed protein product [Prorocentrum cordatum]|uniref:Uncharacterized protein n=1 Tax=Prorocentrum cordatum TaxID=2364126 RepID=A0ABN9TIM3_9DINO|nr:unnamed protein product [Polarella glacialis]
MATPRRPAGTLGLGRGAPGSDGEPRGPAAVGRAGAAACAWDPSGRMTDPGPGTFQRPLAGRAGDEWKGHAVERRSAGVEAERRRSVMDAMLGRKRPAESDDGQPQLAPLASASARGPRAPCFDVADVDFCGEARTSRSRRAAPLLPSLGVPSGRAASNAVSGSSSARVGGRAGIREDQDGEAVMSMPLGRFSSSAGAQSMPVGGRLRRPQVRRLRGLAEARSGAGVTEGRAPGAEADRPSRRSLNSSKSSFASPRLTAATVHSGSATSGDEAGGADHDGVVSQSWPVRRASASPEAGASPQASSSSLGRSVDVPMERLSTVSDTLLQAPGWSRPRVVSGGSGPGASHQAPPGVDIEDQLLNSRASMLERFISGGSNTSGDQALDEIVHASSQTFISGVSTLRERVQTLRRASRQFEEELQAVSKADRLKQQFRAKLRATSETAQDSDEDSWPTDSEKDDSDSDWGPLRVNARGL